MRKILLSSAFVVFSVLTAFAGHVDTYGIGSKATAMGGAVVAGIDDPFAIYYNPAAMVNMKKPTMSLGVHIIDPSLEIREFDVDNSGAFAEADMSQSGIEDKAGLLKIPHFGYVHPLNDKVTIGVAFYVPYGLDLKWDSTEDNNIAAYNTFHSWYMREVLTPAASYKINDKFSVGAGLSVGKAKAGNERIRYVPAAMKNSGAWQAAIAAAYPAMPAPQVTALGNALSAAYTELDNQEIKVDLEDEMNLSFNLGALYKFNDKVSAGISYRSYSNIDLEGSVDTADMTYWNNEHLDASTSVDTPDSIQFGVEYKFSPKFKVEADIVRTFWSRIDAYTVEFDDYFLQSAIAGSGILGANEEPFERNWRDTWQYRLGMEYKLNDTVDLRAGYYYDQSVVPEDTFDVLWPDSNKHVLSGGVGLNFGQVTVDGVVQYIHIEEVTISSGASENLDGSYTRPGYHTGEVSAIAGGHIWSLGVTVSYKF